MENFKIKFASSSLLALLFALITGVLAVSDRAVFRYEMFNPWFFAAFYPYAMGSSYLIDLVCRDNFKKLLGYIFMGAIPFILYFGVDTDMGFVVGLYVAPIGIVCALIYYFFTNMVKDSRVLKDVIGWVIPIVLLAMTFAHFTFPAKKEFHQQYTNHGYQASFESLTGAVKVRLPVEKGDEIAVTVRVKDNGMGGYGYHFEDKNGKYVLTDEKGTNTMSFKAERKEPYYFVYQAQRLKGEVEVKWEVNEPKKK